MQQRAACNSLYSEGGLLLHECLECLAEQLPLRSQEAPSRRLTHGQVLSRQKCTKQALCSCQLLSTAACANPGSRHNFAAQQVDLQPSIVHSCLQVDLPPITEEEKGEVEDPDRDDETDSPKEHTPEAMGAAAVARRASMALPPAPQRAKPPSGGRILPVGVCSCWEAVHRFVCEAARNRIA